MQARGEGIVLDQFANPDNPQVAGVDGSKRNVKFARHVRESMVHLGGVSRQYLQRIFHPYSSTCEW